MSNFPSSLLFPRRCEYRTRIEYVHNIILNYPLKNSYKSYLRSFKMSLSAYIIVFFAEYFYQLRVARKRSKERYKINALFSNDPTPMSKVKRLPSDFEVLIRSS